MGIEHREKPEPEHSRRCPCCAHLSTVQVGEAEEPYVSLFAGCVGPYFICQNPACNVERIYNGNLVMVTGGEWPGE